MRFWAGELPTARSLFLEAVQAGAREGNELTRPYRLYDLALLESAEGRFEEARELARQGLEAAEDAHFPPGSLHYPNAVAAMWLGETTEARASAETLRSWAEPRGERTAVVRAMLVEGQILLSEGDAVSATTPLLEAAELLHEIGIGEPGAFPVLPEAIEAAALSGDLDRADILLDRLEAQRRAVQTVWAAAAVERSRGVILAARGEHEAAASSLEEVAETFEGLGFLPESARAIHLRGLALLRGGQRTAAADAFATARVRFDGMHAPSWASRAAEELERAAPGRATGRLTKTERRIAELVAAGKKNRQIAESMFVSVATVEAHLTRIYRKLGIRSRAELTRLVTAGEVDT
jgi:DNA-binding NarL/FixJ family response regulator